VSILKTITVRLNHTFTWCFTGRLYHWEQCHS